MNTTQSKTIKYTILITLLILAGLFLFKTKKPQEKTYQDTHTSNTSENPTNNNPSTTPPATSTPNTTTTPKPSSSIPTSFALKVPFTPQAPTANWDELHNEACEEASAIMAAAYFAGDTRAKIPASEVEAEISKLTEWQKQNFGYYLDSTLKETAQMIEAVYGLKTKIVSDFTEEQLKQEISSGNVVIIPENGRDLGNPNYKAPGPIYHMLVIRGYTSTKIITNDSGTRNGENYTYTFETLKNAGADWDHATDTIDQTKKLMLVVSK